MVDTKSTNTPELSKLIQRLNKAVIDYQCYTSELNTGLQKISSYSEPVDADCSLENEPTSFSEDLLITIRRIEDNNNEFLKSLRHLQTMI